MQLLACDTVPLLVETKPMPIEDNGFFANMANELRPFWKGALPIDQSKAEFDAQRLPERDQPVAGVEFRRLSHIPSVKAALHAFSDRKGFLRNTNALVYNPMSFMRWHTNSNAPGRRHYFTFTEGEAIFRWRHPVTGKIFDEIDERGWTYRTFIISPAQPVWHTIWTEKVRLSFGFNSSVI